MKIKIDVKTLIDAMEWWISQEEINESPQNVRTVAEHFGLNPSTLWYAIRMNLKIISPWMYEQINSYISRNRRGEATATEYKPKKFAENYVRILNNQPVLKSTRTYTKPALKTEPAIVQNESSELPVHEHECVCKASKENICEKKNKCAKMQVRLGDAQKHLNQMSQDMLKQAGKLFITAKNQNILIDRALTIQTTMQIVSDAYNLLGEILDIKE